MEEGREASSTFSAFCTGFQDNGSHVEYIFHIVHLQSGCAWKVRRRYSEILLVHEFLSGYADKLPAFPPKAFQSWSLLFGESLPVQRVSAFQEYFRQLLSRQDVVAKPRLQQLLGVERPPPVTASVRRWIVETSVHSTVDLELDISADTFSPPDEGSSPYESTSTSCAPTESILVQWKGASPEHDPLASGKPNEPICVRGLPCGEEAVLEVMALNGVGKSEPFELQLIAPGERQAVLEPGMRVRAVWAGDGTTYDAVVHSYQRDSGYVLVDWLRPAPLSGKKLKCVCEVGDDTDHRLVARSCVHPLPEDTSSQLLSDEEELGRT
mmetsp:Transcript_48109/g.97974  ORF Transcript_48109/g.97974 Transcript_48109/m.97974 type:complete len:324 (-) Transcript_48109:32-1003(-)